jgi:ferritin-like metal-binding protein YciE
LEDGTVIVILNGAISEINPKAEQPEVEVEVEQTTADFTTQINTLSEVLNSLTARIEGIEKTVAAQSFAKVEDLNSIKEVVTKTYAVVEGLVNTQLHQ